MKWTEFKCSGKKMIKDKWNGVKPIRVPRMAKRLILDREAAERGEAFIHVKPPTNK